jgi:membrane fusion protein, multidrug efflux system
MKKQIFGILMITVLLIAGCGNKENVEAKNMEQIYEESGIPVKIIVMNPQKFNLELPFTAKITGLKQANASAMIGGMIEKVHVKVGDYVVEDQVLVEFPEDAPAGHLTQARSTYELAKATYDRMKNLYDLGGISRQELDGVETQYKVAEANLDAALQMLKVRAPINGNVISLTVRETDGVESETVLATISQTDMMKAKVWVTESEISLIETGQEASFNWNDQVLKGEVTTVALAMDMKHNAFGIDLIFDNPDNLCKSGVIGDINITTYTNETAFVVSRKNVSNDEQGRFVYIMKDDTAVKQYISTGQENGQFEVLSGIEPGDNVIVEGLNLVTDGVKVKVVE